MISQLNGACVQNKLQLQSIAEVQNMEQVEMCSSVFIQGDEYSSMVEKAVEDYVVVWFSTVAHRDKTLAQIENTCTNRKHLHKS